MVCLGGQAMMGDVLARSMTGEEERSPVSVCFDRGEIQVCIMVVRSVGGRLQGIDELRPPHHWGAVGGRCCSNRLHSLEVHIH
eukprot:46526-Eustigmatos_ZCMA.PRE.1